VASTGKPRGVLIAGNWKMNHGPRETEAFFAGLAPALPADAQQALRAGGLRACVCPPAVSLEAAVRASGRSPFPVAVASQNTHWEAQGAFTGELSAPMLEELGVKATLVGHSERRQLFGETDETARKRTQALLGRGFHVVLCVGETRAEREQGATEKVVARQLEAALGWEGAAAYLDGRLTVAYEPVWAIGTGLTATPAQAEEAHQFLRKLLWDRFGMQAAGRTSILYGGSVTPENVASILAGPNVDGALVGGASLKPAGFAALLSAGADAAGKA
jgi:triosephosphate isomerase (TIM)